MPPYYVQDKIKIGFVLLIYSGPTCRWQSFDYDDLMKRDKVNLDIF